MAIEKRESELNRLRIERYKILQNAIFGGLSPAEEAEYKRKADRIHDLESEIQASAVRSLQSEEQKRQWGREPETDTSQTDARQPYRSRERDTTSPNDLRRQRRRTKAGRLKNPASD